MSRRILVFCVFAVAAAILFARLGLWQVARLHERQAWNASITQARLNNPLPLLRLGNDTSAAHYRFATVDGRYDYEHELILSNRTRRGSPGVEILTPVRMPGTDTVVLVNRGWVYSPDGTSVDQVKWRERDTAHVAGYVELFSTDTAITAAANPRVIRRVGRANVTAKLPYPVAPFYLVAVGDSADLSHPARRDLPVLDDGPHRGYAAQWFSFALIALVGAAIVARRDPSRRSGSTDASDEFAL
ncbi:MAG: Surfeit locus 1 family protein [Gemmatimonadetes bacterium]|nr:Surfeit locus 1 family protein [Gemmatimonadota bacterium]